MKRLLQTLRIFFTLLCLILFIATAALYFRSQRHLDQFDFYRPRYYRSIWAVEGRFYVFLWSAPKQYWGESRSGFGGGNLSRLKYSVQMPYTFGPFGCGRATSTNPALVTATGYTIMFPHWFVLLFFSLPLAFTIRRFLKHRSIRFRAANALCLRCGYDIRATPARCPECGLQISPPPAQF